MLPMTRPLMILVAGPYRSGTDDEPTRIAANMRTMHEAALQLWQRGHIPIVGEDITLPLVVLAGSQRLGDAPFNAIMHPLSRLLMARCDAVLRVGGPSAGADEMVAIAEAQGHRIFHSLAEVPAVHDADAASLYPNHGENAKVAIHAVEVLSEDWGRLQKTTYAYQRNDGQWETQTRETYDRGNGATILLYHPAKGTVILTQQFRLPAYVNGHDGVLIEACAGLLDADEAEECIKRETQEETGYQVATPTKIFEVFMSPGSVTERLAFFIATYADEARVTRGGGVAGEDITVLEVHLDEALRMIETGAIMDGKTIMLLQYAKLHRLMD